MKFLSSIKLTFFLLLALTLAMGMGVGLHLSLPDTFKSMNTLHTAQWIPQIARAHPKVLIWFLLLCFSAGLLGLNALFCCVTRLWERARQTRESRHWLFLVLHLVFILVLGCHGLMLVVGDKQDFAPFYPGEEQVRGEFRVRVDEITFTGDLSILELPRKKRRDFMTRKNIRLDENKAIITLFQGEKRLKTQEIKVLSPMRLGGIQLTLTQFTAPKPGTPTPGVKLFLSTIPLTPIFFAVYAILIATLTLFTLLTWKPRERKINGPLPRSTQPFDRNAPDRG